MQKFARAAAMLICVGVGLAGCAVAQSQGSLGLYAGPPLSLLAQEPPRPQEEIPPRPVAEVSAYPPAVIRMQAVPQTQSEYAPDTIIVSTRERVLYYVDQSGRTMKYPIGVGRAGFEWSGNAYVAAKKEWPDWTPPKAMLLRQPYLPRQMRGGIENPLGARALYLFDAKNRGRDTQYRIHGTNDPQSIGRNVSSGCIRLLNRDIIDLYNRVGVGTKVVVL